MSIRLSILTIRDLLGILLPIGPALAIFSFLVLIAEIRADEFSGRVVGVSDGDTISVMHDGRAVDNGSQLLLASLLLPRSQILV